MAEVEKEQRAHSLELGRLGTEFANVLETFREMRRSLYSVAVAVVIAAVLQLILSQGG